MKRDFRSLLNKLSDQNMPQISPAIIKILQGHGEPSVPVLLDCLYRMCMISPNYQVYYVSLLQTASNIDNGVFEKPIKDGLRALWSRFLESCEWDMPSDLVLVSQSPPGGEGDDAEFCEYVAWKKEAVAKIELWCKLCIDKVSPLTHADVKGLWGLLIKRVDEYWNATMYKHAEVMFELVYAMLHQLQFLNNPTTQEKVEGWKNMVTTANLPGPFRFRLLDAIEFLQRHSRKFPKKGSSSESRIGIGSTRPKNPPRATSSQDEHTGWRGLQVGDH